PSFKWVQPKNKKEECKIYVGINPNDDKTIKSGYSLLWDGECKDGFAYGLGREIENTMLENLQQIGFYENGKAVDYCVVFDPINNWEVNGECSYDFNRPDHYVKTLINEKNGDLQISYEFGIKASRNNAQMIMKTYPFYNQIDYLKVYPNFSYVIADKTRDEFDDKSYIFGIKDHKNGQLNGFGFQKSKAGYMSSGEVIGGRIVRAVELPESYINRGNAIFSEIKNEANIALNAQRKALNIKEKYKNQICKDSIKIDFMDNDEYKAICKEDEKIAELKIKIDAKLAQINQAKQAKREQMSQERLVQVREAEAMAAQRRAAAAEEANNQAAWDSVNRSIQNMNNNMQMQQLNNNLMMYNFMPKRHDVYLH
ncbi:MAG: hypothetical protein WCZ70_09930, partial [Sulfurimonadaceae bacterium]